ncbi:MAG: PorP/SprF family type IX secretion system membrane protein [Bacteroidota bacterium]|nr:PorP/SprF family type IX secretion system membrane protein [Bacteroidota bacterium]
MKKEIIRFAVILLWTFNSYSTQLYGQDVTFTHFLQNPIYYNPASVGIDQGFLISLNYRRALMYLPSKFETIAVGMDQSLHDTEIQGLGGVGLFLTRNQEGDGNYSTTALGIPFSARVIVNEKLKFQAGIAPVFYQKSINFDNLVFFDQLNPYYGVVIPKSQYSLLTSNQSVNFFDFHIGLFGRYESDPTDQSNVRNNVFDFGLSIQHLPEPNQSFEHITAKLPSKYSLMMRYSHVLATYGYQQAAVQPLMLLEKQGSMEDIITGINFKYKTFSAGGYMRHEQNSLLNVTELMMLLGTEFQLHERSYSSMQLNYSFDLLVHSKQVNKNVTNELSIILKLPSLYHSKDPCHFRF